MKQLTETRGTNNKSNLGANSILAVSLAIIKAKALYDKSPLFKNFGEYEIYKDCYPV